MSPGGPDAYSGRLIFDHVPKTAGQAISAWLEDVLGNGIVRSKLVAKHAEFRAQGREFPIVTGHVLFAPGEGLDPRYQYATLLREPVGRVLSWIRFVMRNHERAALPHLYDAVHAFMESEGEEFAPVLKAYLLNPQARHFARIFGTSHLDEEATVAAAFRAVSMYDCLGIYERLDEFVASLAELIGIPAPESLRPVNVTASQPADKRISDALRERLLQLTALDRRLYQRVVSLVDQRLRTAPPNPPEKSRWARYDLPQPTEPVHSVASRKTAGIGALLLSRLKRR